jgi:hypothetical protein
MREPQTLLKAGIHSRPAEFHDVCQLIWSLGRDAFRDADSRQFVQFLREAGEVLGREEVDGNQTLGVPLRALEIALAADKPERRECALTEMVETCPLWLSGRVLNRLHGQLKRHADTGVPPVGELVYVDDGQQKRHSEKWRGLARSWLTERGSSQAASANWSPYYVLLSMRWLDEEPDSIRGMADHMLLTGFTDIETFFGDYCTGDVNHVALDEVQWPCLPSAKLLVQLAEQSKDFQTNHGHLFRLFKARRDQEEEAGPTEDEASTEGDPS